MAVFREKMPFELQAPSRPNPTIGPIQGTASIRGKCTFSSTPSGTKPRLYRPANCLASAQQNWDNLRKGDDRPHLYLLLSDMEPEECVQGAWAERILIVNQHISRAPIKRMPSDPNNPEVLVSVRTDVEAATIVSALAARGIGASTTGGYTAGFRAEAPGCVNVIVKYGDQDRAILALAEIEQDQDIDWSQIDVGEPDGWTANMSGTSAPFISAFRHHVRTLLVLMLLASLALTFWRNHPEAFELSLVGVVMSNALGIFLALFVTYVLRIPRDGLLPWKPDETLP